ncbi:putative cell-wall associated endopeptidase [Flavobacteria bacterium BAL38]|nr:putative cell-wall associated endopeptidase [Flavobacteria bacterium BAL38]
MKFVTFITFSLFLFSVTVFSQKTIKHTVVQGESIYSIAKKYNVTESDIYELNPKSKGAILQLNTVLIIPNDKKNKSKSVDKPSKKNADVYEIQSGDSFYSIAKNNNITVKELKKFNPGVNPNKLQIGDIINLKKNKKSNSSNSESSQDNNSQNNSEYHIVSKGETLSKIAKKYNLKLNELIAFNNLTDSNIQIGQKIYLKKGFVLNNNNPIDNTDIEVVSDDDIEEADDSGEITHLVLKGETLSSVARLYNMKLGQIKELNPRVGDNLSIGHKLIIKKGKVTSVIVEEDIVEEAAPMSDENLSKADRLIAIASENIGTRYRGGGKSQGGFDCSGLMCYTFEQLEINLPRNSASQSEIGKKIKRKNAQKGDLIFFTTNGRGTINHVGMITEVYDDDIKFIHSSVSSGVIISSINEAYYSKRFKKVVRVLND